MTDRRYGPRYAEVSGRWFEASEIAKLMRRDIKAAIKAGELPGKFANYRVRVSNYSMGRSIEVRAINLEGMWQDCDGTVPGTETVYDDGSASAQACPSYTHADARPGAAPHRTLTAEGRRVRKVLEAIHWAYNYDGSDSMTDYYDKNYGGSADVMTEGGWLR
jgi:antirestriction protein